MSSLRDPPTPAVHGGASFEALGTDFRQLHRKGEIVNADVLDAWYDASPRALSAVAEHLPWLLRTSPPTHADGLLRAVAEARGLPEENIVVGAGSSSLACLAIPQLVKAGDRVLLVDPSYGEYAHLLEVGLGMRCQRTRLLPELGFRPNLETILADMATADVVLLVNPNNPTGTRFTREDLALILEATPRFGWLIVDETYVDFAPDGTSIESWVPEHDNLIVLKSLSKFLALSGARAGYLAGPPDFVDKIRLSSPPWAVSLIAQVAVVEALRDTEYYRQKSEETRLLRETLAEWIGSIPGVKVHESVTNFLMLEILSEITSAEVVARCREHGVYLRNCDDQGRDLGGRFVRTAVKDAASNERIASALREVLPAPAVSEVLPEVTAPTESIAPESAEPPSVTPPEAPVEGGS